MIEAANIGIQWSANSARQLMPGVESVVKVKIASFCEIDIP
jgi:hypothetical protein